MGLKRTKRKPKKDQLHNCLTIHVGTAGIGRQHFKAWIEGIDDIDRQDSDDYYVFTTPYKAVKARMKDFEREINQWGWDHFTREDI